MAPEWRGRVSGTGAGGCRATFLFWLGADCAFGSADVAVTADAGGTTGGAGAKGTAANAAGDDTTTSPEPYRGRRERNTRCAVSLGSLSSGPRSTFTPSRTTTLQPVRE